MSSEAKGDAEMENISLLSLLREEDNILSNIRATISCIRRAKELAVEDEMWNEVLEKDNATLSSAQKELDDVREQMRKYFHEVMEIR